LIFKYIFIPGQQLHLLLHSRIAALPSRIDFLTIVGIRDLRKCQKNAAKNDQNRENRSVSVSFSHWALLLVKGRISDSDSPNPNL
jgi:hypothetical protein